jgi:serine/threonine protein kinase
MFKQMLSALRTLKQAEIAHLDLKLENIFLDEDFNIKLGDFGYAQRTNYSDFLSTWQGTSGYIAP